MPRAQAKKLPVDAPERRRLPILLRHAWYGLNQTFRRRIAHLGITPDQFTVMRTLREGPPEGLGQSELIRRMASDPNTIASLVLRMEKAGLIERRTHAQDRRANLLTLLPEGVARYEAAREVALALQTSILAGFTAAEREKFLTQLSAVADACQDALDQSPRKVTPAAKRPAAPPA